MSRKIRDIIKDLENIGLINRGGKKLVPRPLSGKDFVNAMQKVA